MNTYKSYYDELADYLENTVFNNNLGIEINRKLLNLSNGLRERNFNNVGKYVWMAENYIRLIQQINNGKKEEVSGIRR